MTASPTTKAAFRDNCLRNVDDRMLLGAKPLTADRAQHAKMTFTSCNILLIASNSLVAPYVKDRLLYGTDNGEVGRMLPMESSVDSVWHISEVKKVRKRNALMH